MKINTLFITILSLLILSVSATAQSPDITADDLSQVKVDELSDNQVREFMRQAEQVGMTEAELESEAISRGMPYSEILKLRSRIEELEEEERAAEARERDEREAAVDPPDTLRPDVPDAELRTFGRELFRTEELTFEPSLNIPTPKNYVLGPGDQILINVWGASRQNYSERVQPGGYIQLENLGNIQVNGLTIEEASTLIIQRLGAIYSGLISSEPNTFAHVTLGDIRSIQVTITGEAFMPGTYTLPSLASVFNALYLAGGPGEKGSFRDIRVIRENETVASIDLYDFLAGGDMSGNIRLKDEDLIYVGTYNNRIRLEGEVKHPALFELKDGETLEELVDYAGGFSERAYTHRVKIIRKTDRQQEILDVEQPLYGSVVMHSGDEVRVDAVLDRFENLVTVQGAVFRPGRFAYRDGMTLTDLVELADGLREDAFMNRASIYREQENRRTEVISVDLNRIYNGDAEDPVLQPHDLVSISSIFELEENFTVQIQGHVRKDSIFPYTEGITLGELIREAGGLRESASLARVEVARRISDPEATTPGEQTAEVFSFPLGKDLALEDEASSFELHPFDIVFVRRSPNYFTQQLVTIEGEVAFPGTYAIEKKGERITDLIKRAGGLTKEAYLEGASLQRQTDFTGVDGGEMRFVGADFPALWEDPGSRENLRLMQGDVIEIPQELQTVSLSGALQFPVTTRYREGMSVRNYISEAGGFAENADKKRLYVRYANGTSDRTRRFLGIRSYPEVKPGAEIVVPTKPEREGRSLQEVMAITSSAASIAAMVVAIINNL